MQVGGGKADKSGECANVEYFLAVGDQKASLEHSCVGRTDTIVERLPRATRCASCRLCRCLSGSAGRASGGRLGARRLLEWTRLEGFLAD
jgi:hypothetical protein